MPKFEIIVNTCEVYDERYVIEADSLDEAEGKVFTEDPVEQLGGKINREIVTSKELPSMSRKVFYVPGGNSIIDLVKDSGRGAYSGETLEEVQVRYPGAEIGDLDTVSDQIEQSFRSPPARITEERYMEMLGVLPPEGWVSRNGWSTFKLCEHTSGLVTAIFAHDRDSDVYWEMQDLCTLGHEEIKAACQAVQ